MFPYFCDITFDQRAKKAEPQTHDHYSGKFAVNYIFKKIPPHLATLTCETLMPAKQALNDKFEGSVATHLTCGGVANNQIKIGLLLSLRVNIW